MRTLSQLRRGGLLFACVLFLLHALAGEGAAQTVARCGKGWLELVDSATD